MARQATTPKAAGRTPRALAPLLAVVMAAIMAACAGSQGTVGEGATFGDNATTVPQEYHFADLNGEQLASAKRFGIARPAKDRRDARRITRRLKRVESGQLYLVDPLSHSVPYLTKGARSLLEDIAEGFQYVLRRRGYRPHRIIVTSLLRTEADVADLRRVNGVAARNSSHLYATTFDLSYTRFNRISTEGKPVSNDEMARILAIVISEFRKRGECVVIYERSQHCFHITARR